MAVLPGRKPAPGSGRGVAGAGAAVRRGRTVGTGHCRRTALVGPGRVGRGRPAGADAPVRPVGPAQRGPAPVPGMRAHFGQGAGGRTAGRDPAASPGYPGEPPHAAEPHHTRRSGAPARNSKPARGDPKPVLSAGGAGGGKHGPAARLPGAGAAGLLVGAAGRGRDWQDAPGRRFSGVCPVPGGQRADRPLLRRRDKPGLCPLYRRPAQRPTRPGDGQTAARPPQAVAGQRRPPAARAEPTWKRAPPQQLPPGQQRPGRLL